MLERLKIWWENRSVRASDAELRSQINDLKYQLQQANKQITELKDDNFSLEEDLKKAESESFLKEKEIDLLTLIIERNKHRILMDTGVEDER